MDVERLAHSLALLIDQIQTMEMRIIHLFEFVDLTRLDIARKPWPTVIIPYVRPS
jgi:hypothetical protein